MTILGRPVNLQVKKDISVAIRSSIYCRHSFNASNRFEMAESRFCPNFVLRKQAKLD